MDDVLCEDEKEFIDVLEVIEKGIGAENKEIEQENEDLESHTEKIKKKNAKIEGKVAALDEKMDTIKEEIARLDEERLKEKDWEKVKATIDDIDEKIAVLQKQIVQSKAPDEAKEKKDGAKEDKETAIATFQKQIDELNEQKAQEEQDGAKGKEIAEKLSVQRELLSQKKQQKKEQLDEKATLGKRRDPIEPIRTKQKKGGPRWEKIRKLVMRDLAEGKRGWISKRDDSGSEVEIETLFKGKLAPFAKYLKDEDYENMEDIMCEDADEFEEIIRVIEAGITTDKGKPLKKGTSGKESTALKALKKMCLKESAAAEDGWIEQQKKKKKTVTEQLNEVSPLLAIFFGEIDVAVNEARKYLAYETQKTPAQRLAITNAVQNEEKLKAIQLASGEAVTDEEKEKGAPDAMDEMDKGINDSKNKNPKGLSKEEAGALDLTRKENAAYVTAAVVKLHVVDALAPKFEQGDQPETRKTGLTLARDVESCSLQIMQSQATIRSSLVI
eukprot:560907_1